MFRHPPILTGSHRNTQSTGEAFPRPRHKRTISELPITVRKTINMPASSDESSDSEIQEPPSELSVNQVDESELVIRAIMKQQQYQLAQGDFSPIYSQDEDSPNRYSFEDFTELQKGVQLVVESNQRNLTEIQSRRQYVKQQLLMMFGDKAEDDETEKPVSSVRESFASNSTVKAPGSSILKQALRQFDYDSPKVQKSEVSAGNKHRVQAMLEKILKGNREAQQDIQRTIQQIPKTCQLTILLRNKSAYWGLYINEEDALIRLSGEGCPDQIVQNMINYRFVIDVATRQFWPSKETVDAITIHM